MRPMPDLLRYCSSTIKQTLLLVQAKSIYRRRAVDNRRNVMADQDYAASHGQGLSLRFPQTPESSLASSHSRFIGA
jgi:hypothetical protein